MAFEAKDGSKHSMASRMRARNSGIEAKGQTKAPEQILDQPGGEDEQEKPQDGGEQVQGLQDPQQVAAAFQQVMGAVQQGQQPDPSMAKALCDYFEQFAQQDQGSEDQGEGEAYQ